ncbi:hypothetical protein [Jannaschia sp. CCS1]|uniref:hypothetical protein n=1 Tax=Jannaschia sp. (strain CCS1) TaxID=290400 RepID=UPI000053D899|nr:hypothetical protein [Jannaschia sp. CCS1]ABD56478.1 hypothetical protein Jann_3561 [Jannaschia sp. CCS1]
MTRSTKSDIAQTAKETVEDVAATAKANATVKAEAAKEGVADRVSEQAENFRQASNAFEGNDLASDAVQYLGDNLAHAATAVRDMDLGNIQHDMTQFARRNPLVFFGGAAALGFLAARAMKASERAGGTDTLPDRHSYPAISDNPAAYPEHNARRWGYS